jgi:hypothetical protein
MIQSGNENILENICPTTLCEQTRETNEHKGEGVIFPKKKIIEGVGT